MIDISNLDSHIFDALSQTSDNMYIYIADLERDFSRWSKPSVDYFNLPGEFIREYGEGMGTAYPSCRPAYFSGGYRSYF